MNKLPTSIPPSHLLTFGCQTLLSSILALAEGMMGNFSHVKAVSLPLSVPIERLSLCA